MVYDGDRGRRRDRVVLVCVYTGVRDTKSFFQSLSSVYGDTLETS